MNRISSYSYHLALVKPDQLAMLRDLLLEEKPTARAAAHIIVTVEAPTFLKAVAACNDLARIVEDAGLPPLYFKDGSDGCPACGAALDAAGEGETEPQQGQLL